VAFVLYSLKTQQRCGFRVRIYRFSALPIWVLPSILETGGTNAGAFVMDKPAILVVEDNDIQRKVINLLAAEYGFHATLTSTAEEACDAFAVGGDVYSLILMDFRLPDADGSQCAARLREIERPDANRVPIAVMTGYIELESRKAYTAAGFDDCLIKPFSSKDFRQLVERWSNKDHNIVRMIQRSELSG
jgi:CheY-like chemotaxis protein